MTIYAPLKGYAALVSTLVIGAVLMTFSFLAATSTYVARALALRAEQEAQSHANAHACIQLALFELAADASYRPRESGDRVPLGQSGECLIESIVQQEETLVLTVRGAFAEREQRLELTLLLTPSAQPPFMMLTFRKI